TRRHIGRNHSSPELAIDPPLASPPGIARMHGPVQQRGGGSRGAGGQGRIGPAQSMRGGLIERRRPPMRSAATTPTEITATKIVPSALTSGDTPSRVFEKITIGSVDEPGPETKLAITRSSRLSVKASSQP